jgi:ATP-dependent helicase HrpA
MDKDLERLVPGDFLARTPHSQLSHLQRYLKAMIVRAERFAINPVKDAEKAKQLAPFAAWEKRVPAAQHDAFRWMLEEFRVSVFAPELGTPQPVSAARLQKLGGFN